MDNFSLAPSPYLMGGAQELSSFLRYRKISLPEKTERIGREISRVKDLSRLSSQDTGIQQLFPFGVAAAFPAG
jgi:hypothetical protein